MKTNLLLKRLFVAFLLLAVSTVSWAYDFEVDGIFYNRNSDGTSVSVTYMNTSYNSYSGSVIIPSSVTYNNKAYDVTNIGEIAFYNCQNLTSVTIPNSVTTIGQSAFSNCSSLTSIDIPNSVTTIGQSAFSNCSSLTSIDVPNSVTTIGYCAFEFCSALTSITIPNSVKSFGNGMLFRDCTGKLYFDCDIPDDSDWFKWSKFSEIVIGDNVQSIGRNAFSNCTTNISSVIIGNNVTSIDEYAFYGCSNLTSVTIGNNVQTIEGGAFSGCNLTSVDLPESLTSIGNFAFSGCPLSTITIHKNVKTIGQNAFNARQVIINSNDIASKEYSTTSNLLTCLGRAEEYVFGDNVTSIGSYALAYYSGNDNLASVVIGKNVKNIGVGAFKDCNTLEKAEFSSIESLCNISFNNGTISAENGKSNPLYYAKHLYVDGQEIKNVNIPNSITSIGKYTFYGCFYIESITIPEGVTSIGERAFGDCYNLSTLICLAENIPVTEASSFYGYAPARATLYVPASFVDAYNEADNWKGFGSILTLEDKEAGIAARGTCGDNLIYVLSTDSMLTISGTGQMTAAKWSDFKNRIKSVVIEYGVTNVIGTAFKGYSNLTSISIPETVVSIGKQAFYNCINLNSVTCAAIDVPTTGANVFLDVPQSTATLYVPASSVDAYKAASQWKNFGTILPIEEVTEPVYIETDVTNQFPTDYQGWTGATGYTSTQFAPRVTTNDGRYVQVCEKFNGGSATEGTVFTRTLSGLTNGTYRIELFGAAASTKGRDTGIDSEMTAENEGDETAVYLYARTPNGMVQQYIPVHWATSFTEVATAVLNGVEVTDGTIEIGMYSEKKYTNWHVVQIKGVTALVDAEVRHADVLNTAQSVLAEETYANIVGEERTDLEQTISDNATVAERTSTAYKTAIDAIVSATTTFTEAKGSYDEWTYMKNHHYSYATAEKKAAAEAVSEAVPTSAGDAVAKILAMFEPYRRYAESSALMEGVAGAVDMTAYIKNPKAEENIDVMVWQTIRGEGSGGSIKILSGEPWTDGQGSTTHSYFDGGNWGASAWDVTFQQEVTLPKGKYQLTAMGRSETGVTMTLLAADQTAEMVHIGSMGGLFNNGWDLTSVEFELSAESTVTIGVRGVTSTSHNWMSFSDFRLFQFPNGSTGIATLRDEQSVTDNPAIYDLQGRKMMKDLKPGLYIVNGKKLLIK